MVPPTISSIKQVKPPGLQTGGAGTKRPITKPTTSLSAVATRVITFSSTIWLVMYSVCWTITSGATHAMSSFNEKSKVSLEVWMNSRT